MNVLPEREEYSKSPMRNAASSGSIHRQAPCILLLPAYNGLLALQHRGQESCGIAVNRRMA